MKSKDVTVDLKIDLSSDDKQIYLSKDALNNHYSLWFAISYENPLCEVKLNKNDLSKLVDLINKFAELEIELENNTD